ncbi:DUF2934 domain-containing protein [Prosthecobacter sp.]|uniref:DUF2934 domain-containing protein n=1 Tax=Prosthecobacter sp. TaxID=1965333 RepID=UPI001D968748|nr:DUF2934 domain-containing protein [Prosthecobacter sp.]MCB1279348.1 DUF2934 domain-containing protein [Prosthecobacter sp.]
MSDTMKTAKKTSSASKAASKTVAAKSAKSAKKKTNPAKPVRKRTKADAPAPPPEITEEEIATCAYLIYVSEGCPAGRDQEHWLAAEARLKNR